MDEHKLLAKQISEIAITNHHPAFGLPGHPGSVPAIVSLSRQIGLCCQRCVEWSQSISNTQLDPLFREVARELLVFAQSFIESIERSANNSMQEVEKALSKPAGGKVVIHGSLKLDSPDLTRLHAAMEKLKSQI